MKVLIIHASAGNGHRRAADAIAAAYAATGTGAGTGAGAGGRHDVAVIDALDFTPPRFKLFYQRSFESTVKHAPWFYGAVFRASSEAARLRAFRAVRRTFNRAAAHELCDEVGRRNPDVVICTHMLSLDALARRRKRRRLDSALACVVTDYIAHGYWAEPTCDRYYVPTPEVGRGLVARGVRSGTIKVTGIPVDPVFGAPPEREAVRRGLGIDPAARGRRVVLVLGGGLGMGPVAAIVAGLGGRADLPVALEVVCGKNQELRAEVEALVPRLAVPARVHGFVNTIPSLMAASDLVVTKPGGLTTTEALAVGRPMLLFEAMPGQEAGNAAHFVRAGAALEITPEGAGETLAGLLAEPARMEALAARARAISRPHAAREIAEDALLLPRLAFRRTRQRPTAPV